MVATKPSSMVLNYRWTQVVQNKRLQLSITVTNHIPPYVITSNKHTEICHYLTVICNIRYQSTQEEKKHLYWGLTSPNHFYKCQCYLFILLLQLGSLLFIRLFIICSRVVPHLSQFLCDIADGKTRMFSFDFWTKLRAKQEKSRTTEGKEDKVISILGLSIKEKFCDLCYCFFRAFWKST